MNETRNHSTLTAVIVLFIALWTLAAVVTLVYWSGLTVWALGLIGVAMFVWMITVYLRPSRTHSKA